MDKGVVGMSIANIFIIGIVAIIFVGGYTYARSKYMTSLPAI